MRQIPKWGGIKYQLKALLKNKKSLFIFLVGVLLLSGTVSYAYFTAQTNSTGAGISTVSQTVSYEGTDLVTKGGLTFNDTGILPGHKNIASVSVTATGLESLIYNLNWTGTNSLQTPLTYTVYKTDTEVDVSITCEKKNGLLETGITMYYEECTESNFDSLGTAVGSGTIGTYETQTKVPLVINEEIQATREGKSVYYYVVLQYPNLSESQNYDMGGSFDGIVNTEILGEKEMPVVTLSEEYTEASNGWYSNVVINAEASNSVNTVSKLRYCVTTSEECTPGEDNVINATTGKVELDSNKSAQRVCFSGVDKSGLVGLPTCSNAYLVDKSATTTTITLSDSSVLGSNNWYQEATLNITGNNEVSGVSNIKYCVTSNDTCEPTTTVNGTNTSVTLSSSATGQKICATSTDNKGDSSEVACSNLYNVDTVNPVVSINDDYTVTTNSITINVTATDNDSKIASYSYTLNGSEYTSCTTATCTFSGLNSETEYTVGVSVTDLAGRASTTVSKAITTDKPVICNGSACETIMANKTVSTRTSFNAVVTASSTGTMYKAEDDDGESYYFAGAATDNYVYFAGYYWRIIRVNGDGTIRMIYDGTSARANGTSSEDTRIGTSAFYSSWTDNAYVGFKYGTPGSSTYEATHANTNDSTIKGVLDTWYTNNLASYSQYIDTNAGFCGDRTSTTSNTGAPDGTGGYGKTTTYYGARYRLYTNKTPSLKCTNSSDLYTVSGSSKGNKSLTNPIGLISADEVSYAGGEWNTNNTSYYLYTGNYYWTMSPSRFNGADALVCSVDSSGNLRNNLVNDVYGVRPVINLKSDVTLTGDGTIGNEYRVS